MSPIKIRKCTTATFLTYTFGVLLAGLLASYVIFQARLMIAGPQITLIDELPTIQSERQIILQGKAENIRDISLNNRPIVTDESGHFSESIVLENGYTIVSVRAHDRYGRETVIEREFVYTPLSLLN